MIYHLPMRDVSCGSYPLNEDLDGLGQFMTVIDFTRAEERWRKSLPRYSQFVSSECHYQNVPLWAWWMPSEERMTAIILGIEKSPRPVFFHCFHGRDRTGMVAAILLIRQGCECERAIRIVSKRSGVPPKWSIYLDYIRKFCREDFVVRKPSIFPESKLISESDLGKVIDEVEGNVLELIWGEDQVIIQMSFPSLPNKYQVFPFDELDVAIKAWGEQTYLFYRRLYGDSEQGAIKASHDHVGVFRRQIKLLLGRK
jgi:hypothetical protein